MRCTTSSRYSNLLKAPDELRNRGDSIFSMTSLTSRPAPLGPHVAERTGPDTRTRHLSFRVTPFIVRHWIAFGLLCMAVLAGSSIGIGWSLRLRTFNIVTASHVQNGDISMLTEYVSNVVSCSSQLCCIDYVIL